MSNPQQPELARSRKTPAQDQDAVAAVVEGQRIPESEGPTGPVPVDNQPGHHPPKEQDKPDIDAFAERLGTVAPTEPALGSPPTEPTGGSPPTEPDGGSPPTEPAGGSAPTEPAAPAGRSGSRGMVAGLVAAVLVVVLGVMAGRRLRGRSSD
jgi:hypothetical protein